MLPITFYSLCDICSRYRNFLTYRQTGNTCKDFILVAFDTGNIDSSDNNIHRIPGIADVWCNYFILCLCHESHDETENQKAYFLYIIHFLLVFFYLFLCLSKTTLTILITYNGLTQIFFIEIRPISITKIEFTISNL